MQRKTAWSNRSLVGCHVSVLLDSRDWHDGIVTQYHKSGKHCVEFHLLHQKRWLSMLKAAFYIVERPVPPGKEGGELLSSESKEADGLGGGVELLGLGVDDAALAPIDKWCYCEEVTLGYAKAQSMIHRIYGNKIQETGHRTAGHINVLPEDKELARAIKASLLYGELLPRGVNRALDSKHLDACRPNQHTLLDLGMGTGKVVIQVFLQCPNLSFVYGVELSLARYRIAEACALRLVALARIESGPEALHHGGVPRFEVAGHIPDRYLRVRDRAPRRDGRERILLLEWNNLLNCGAYIEAADFVLLETDIPTESMLRLASLLYRMKAGSRMLSYIDLSKVWDPHGMPFTQLEANKSLSDRYPTSWSVHRGHHFFIWCKQQRSMANMFEFYTEARRLPPDAAPPYPTHAPSRLRSLLPSLSSSLAFFRGGGGGGGSINTSVAPPPPVTPQQQQWQRQRQQQQKQQQQQQQQQQRRSGSAFDAFADVADMTDALAAQQRSGHANLAALQPPSSGRAASPVTEQQQHLGQQGHHHQQQQQQQQLQQSPLPQREHHQHQQREQSPQQREQQRGGSSSRAQLEAALGGVVTPPGTSLDPPPTRAKPGGGGGGGDEDEEGLLAVAAGGGPDLRLQSTERVSSQRPSGRASGGGIGGGGGGAAGLQPGAGGGAGAVGGIFLESPPQHQRRSPARTHSAADVDMVLEYGDRRQSPTADRTTDRSVNTVSSSLGLSLQGVNGGGSIQRPHGGDGDYGGYGGGEGGAGGVGYGVGAGVRGRHPSAPAHLGAGAGVGAAAGGATRGGRRTTVATKGCAVM